MYKNIYTIPNILSILRILIVPFYVILYFNQSYTQAIILLIISGLTDVVDGFIARKFHQESELGKLLDPLADKITQISLVVCASMTHHEIIFLLLVVVFKELSMIIFNLFMLKKNMKPISSKWYGKLATACFYVGIGLILLNNVLTFLNVYIIYVIELIIAITLIFAMIKYGILAKKMLAEIDSKDLEKEE
jgi:cardiolipin synthase